MRRSYSYNPDIKVSRPPAPTKATVDKIGNLLFSGSQWTYGRKAREVEKKIAREMGVPAEHVIATDSATVALAALKDTVLNEKVRVSPLTWPSTYLGIRNPSFIDCDDRGQTTPEADIAIDLWGRPASNSNSATVLDAAHRALSPEHCDLLCRGVFVVYSFNVQKEVASPGGGAIVCPLDAHPNTIYNLRAYLACGTVNRTPYLNQGAKGLMNEVSALLVMEGLRKLASNREHRQMVLREYAKHIDEDMLLTQPGEASGHLCVIKLSSAAEREAAYIQLRKSRIETSVHYHLPDIKKRAPVAWDLSERVLSLPCHTGISKTDVRRTLKTMIRIA